jgi:hypothetical protein
MAKKNKNNFDSKQSFQEMLPIETVDRGFIKVKNYMMDEYYPVIVLGDRNLDLMSEDALGAFAHSIQTAINTSDLLSFEILVVPVPYDTEEWQNNIEKRIKEIRQQQNDLSVLIKEKNEAGENISGLEEEMQALTYYIDHLKAQREYVLESLQKEDFSVKKAYFVPKFREQESLVDYQAETNALVENLAAHIPGTRALYSKEIRDLLFILLNPLRKVSTKVKPNSLPPVIKEGF